MSPDDLGEPQHRHLSPLIGLFPGDSIRSDTSPLMLIEAVRRLLELRGTRSNGWADAWRAACWARLKDGEKAYALIGSGLTPPSQYSGTSPNLLNTDMNPDSEDASDPSPFIFQIDANFGMPTAMLEMLLYSRDDHIEILPALPRAWAAKGSVMGIGARGGFTFDIAWRDGQATDVVLRSAIGGLATVVVAGQKLQIDVSA